MEAISIDPGNLLILATLDATRTPIPDWVKPNNLLTMSPVLSGLMLYHFRAEMYETGIALANASTSITQALHLYNAVRHEGFMQSVWPDMEIIRATLGDSNFFVGEAPKNPEDYFRKINIQMGKSIATMTDKRRRNVAFSSRSGPRGIKDGAPVSCMFKDRYLRRTEQVEWTPEYVNQIIDLSMWEQKGNEKDGTPILGQIDDPEKIKAKKQGRGKGNGKGGKKQRGTATEDGLLPPEMLIQALLFALHCESFEFSLPYISMHRQCCRALLAVQRDCSPLLQQVFPITYIEREENLTSVVGLVFGAAVSDDRRLLVQAAETLDRFIRAEGKRVLRTRKQFLWLYSPFLLVSSA